MSEMKGRLLVFIGLFLVIIGLLHPLGFVETTMIKYMLYVGIVLLGLGIIFLPGADES